MKNLFILFVLLGLSFPKNVLAHTHIKDYQWNRDSAKTYPHAAVVSASIIASRIGNQIIKEGGNTVDAAIAVQFALAVVFPPAGNIGGGGFMLIRRQNFNVKGASPEYFALDYRETAPKKASKNMYLDKDGKVVDGESTDGILASGIPGVVDGMVQAHKKFGKLAWNQILKPSILLASLGFPLSEEMASSLNDERGLFLKLNGSLCPFLKKGGEWKKGDLLVQKELGNTLKLIAEKGRAGFYEGIVAERLASQMAVTKIGGSHGLITVQDLKNYHSVWRNPIFQNYKGYKIISMPPPSSGGIALFQLLSTVEDYPIATWGAKSAKYQHLVIEAERRIYADRSFYMGDPDYVKIPVDTLLSKTYNKRRFLDFDSSKASLSSSVHPGIILGYDLSKNIRNESEETTHFSIADANGNAVSVTTTLNGGYGSAVVAKGSGFILNNEMDDFSLKPGTPNAYGLVGGEANSISPGKRMLSSMTPSLVDKEGKLYMVVGSPGGATIITTVFQTIVNVLDFGMNMQEAVSAPRFHSQWLPDTVYLERKFSLDYDVNSLKKLGHIIDDRGTIGRCDAIRVNAEGVLETGADPRGEDQSAGY